MMIEFESAEKVYEKEKIKVRGNLLHVTFVPVLCPLAELLPLPVFTVLITPHHRLSYVFPKSPLKLYQV